MTVPAEGLSDSVNGKKLFERVRDAAERGDLSSIPSHELAIFANAALEVARKSKTPLPTEVEEALHRLVRHAGHSVAKDSSLSEEVKLRLGLGAVRASGIGSLNDTKELETFAHAMLGPVAAGLKTDIEKARKDSIWNLSAFGAEGILMSVGKENSPPREQISYLLRHRARLSREDQTRFSVWKESGRLEFQEENRKQSEQAAAARFRKLLFQGLLSSEEMTSCMQVFFDVCEERDILLTMGRFVIDKRVKFRSADTPSPWKRHTRKRRSR